MIEEEQRYEIPYTDLKGQMAPLGTLFMGTIEERMKHPMFLRLGKFCYYSPDDIAKGKILNEIYRITSALGLPFLRNIQDLTFKYYKNGISHSMISRNCLLLSAVTIYLHYTLNHVFINRKSLIDVINYSMKKFNKCLMHVLRENPYILKKMNTKKFRYKYISNVLLGIKNQFDLPPKFFQCSLKMLSERFSELKHHKNILIVGIICNQVKRDLRREGFKLTPMNHICSYLGIHEDAVRRFRRERRKGDVSY